MLDGQVESINVTVGSSDFVIQQSPAVLRSNREAGTTGAAVWRASVQFAQWLHADHRDNVLFTSAVLGPDSDVLELG